MSALMRTNPMLGMWLGGMHAWMRMVHFGTGAWMLDRKRGGDATDGEAVLSQAGVSVAVAAATAPKA
ncbi:hypothetical protein AAFN86_28695 [Roseomonas sp. CAU 1739]|uniref:hypothetical protein n=1 Tax=Roseomonas sp. CAU 1739 TaxID=3140364 RepID=UPI00325B66AE